MGGEASLDDEARASRGRRLSPSDVPAVAGGTDAGQEFVEDDTEAEDVGASVEWLAQACSGNM